MSCEQREHQLQQQARLIDALTSPGVLGFFQRRRLRKLRQAGEIVRQIREDELRADNLRLKSFLRAEQAETANLRQRLMRLRERLRPDAPQA